MPIALAGIPVVIVGLMALLIILAGGLLIETVGRGISSGFRIPGLDYVAGWVQSGINSALNAMSGLLDGAVKGVSSLFTAAPHAFAAALAAIESFAWQHWKWIHDIITVDIPSIWNSLWAQVGALYDYIGTVENWLYRTLVEYVQSAERYVLGVISAVQAGILKYVGDVENYLGALIANSIASLTSYVQSLYKAATDYISSIYNTLMGFITSQITAVEQYAEGLARWAIGQAVSIAEQYAKQYADWLVNELLRGLNVACATALAPVWPQVFDDIEAIARAIPGSLADIFIRIGRIPRVVPFDIPAILSMVFAIGAIAIDWVVKCGTKLCANLDGFADEVGGLSDEILTAGMIAFVAEAIANPEGTARATDDYVIEPVLSAGKDFASLVGVSL